uniref:Non-specific lethal 2 homolog n=1 Tax=Rhabditophanes sp. KR3021 TaxID=114890 RepID=A0AC35TW27_9BILA
MPATFECLYVSSSTGIKCPSKGPSIALNEKKHCNVHLLPDHIAENARYARRDKLYASKYKDAKIGVDNRTSQVPKIPWNSYRDDDDLLRCSSDWAQTNNLEGNDNMFYDEFYGTTVTSEGHVTELEILRNQKLLINQRIELLEEFQKVSKDEMMAKNAFYREAMLEEMRDGCFAVRSTEEKLLKSEIQKMFKFSAEEDHEYHRLMFKSNKVFNEQDKVKKEVESAAAEKKKQIAEAAGTTIKEEPVKDANDKICCLEDMIQGKCQNKTLFASSYCREHILNDHAQLLFERCDSCSHSFIPQVDFHECLPAETLHPNYANKLKHNMTKGQINQKIIKRIPNQVMNVRSRPIQSHEVKSIPIRRVYVDVGKLPVKRRFEKRAIKDGETIILNDEESSPPKTQKMDDIIENVAKGPEKIDTSKMDLIEIIDNHFAEFRPLASLLPSAAQIMPPVVPKIAPMPIRRITPSLKPLTTGNSGFVLSQKTVPARKIEELNRIIDNRLPRKTFEEIIRNKDIGESFRQFKCARARPFIEDFFPRSDVKLASPAGQNRNQATQRIIHVNAGKPMRTLPLMSQATRPPMVMMARPNQPIRGNIRFVTAGERVAPQNIGSRPVSRAGQAVSTAARTIPSTLVRFPAPTQPHVPIRDPLTGQQLRPQRPDTRAIPRGNNQSHLQPQQRQIRQPTPQNIGEANRFPRSRAHPPATRNTSLFRPMESMIQQPPRRTTPQPTRKSNGPK